MNQLFISRFLVFGFALLWSQFTLAETLNCGLKIVTINNGKIEQIKHEDGSVHSGSSVSDNWSYDGKSIKHKMLSEKIQCGNKPKTRNEVVTELSSRFSKNPNLHGMTKQEALLMTKYTANLMNTDKNCHLLVDASKSTQRNEMFFIDCNDVSGNAHRYWVSSENLRSGQAKASATPISETMAIDICNKELRLKTTNPSTYNASLLTGTTSRAIKSTGRNIIEINFSAKNSFGHVSDFKGRCTLESGQLIEAVIENR